MATILTMPNKATINGYKGVLDFYVHRGIPCVRTWPRYDESHMTQAARDQRPYFAYINQMASTLPPHIVEAYQAMASSTRLTWKDYLVRCYLNGDKV